MCWQLVWHVCRDLSLSVHISQHWGTNHAVRRRSMYARSRYGCRWWTEASNTVTSWHRERCLQVHEESYEGNKIQWASLEGMVLFLFVCSCHWLIQPLTSPILTLFFQMSLGWPVPSWFFPAHVLSDEWHWFLLPGCPSTVVSKHWRTLKSTDPRQWPLLIFFHLPPDFWQQGVAPFMPPLQWIIGLFNINGTGILRVCFIVYVTFIIITVHTLRF